MLTIIIALIGGLISGYYSTEAWGVYWGIFCGLFVMVVIQILISIFVRKKITAVNTEIQNHMLEAQEKLNRKVQQMQRRMSGNPKTMQTILEKEQNLSIQGALELTDKMKKYSLWNIMLDKQINTMKMMLYFRLKDFAMTDKLLKKCMLFDAQSITIKMCRMYKNHTPGMDKFFKAKIRRLKGEDNSFAASVYAWILVKENKTDEAMAVLANSRKKNDNHIVKENFERLANGKIKQFSNAPFGDMWYGLYLEEPKMKIQRMEQRAF